MILPDKKDHFDPLYLYLANNFLLRLPFDSIFYKGSLHEDNPNNNKETVMTINN